MRILIDADGVMLNFVAAVSYVGRFVNGGEWDGSTTIEEFYGEWAIQVKEMISDRWFHERVHPYEGVREWLTARRAEGHELIALTAPWKGSQSWHACRVFALSKLGFNEDQIIFAPRRQKPFVYGDMLIEDHVETALGWSYVQDGNAAIILHPHNRKWADETCRYRADLGTEARARIQLFNALSEVAVTQ